jgi:nitrogen-specific signal transduction histidine kinase
MDTAVLLGQVFSTIRAGILGIDTRKEIFLMNPAARALLSLPANPAPEGRAIEEVLAPYPELVALLTKALHHRTSVDRTEVRVTGQRSLILGATVTPLSHPDGTPLGLVALFKDLTQIERGEEQTQLKDRLAALGHMAAGLAHEMRNPLASIKVTVGLLRKTFAKDPDLDRKLRSILSEVQRLNQTITDCLAFARPIRFEPRRARIEEIVEHVLSQIISFEHTYPFQIVRRFDPATPEAWLDAQQLEIVFYNIINNAIDATRQRHGTIVISTGVTWPPGSEDTNPGLIVTVSDNGEGIPPARIPKLFMPFFTTKNKGSGLGLANAKKIIDHLHGTIEVTSEIGVGTTFTIRIPLVSDALARAS